MKKKPIKNLIFILMLTMVMVFVVYNMSGFGEYKEGVVINRTAEKDSIKKDEEKRIYSVYSEDKLLKTFEKFEDAIYYADMQTDAYVMKKGSTEWLWHNIPKYHIYSGSKFIEKSDNYVDAVNKASKYEKGYVYNYDDSVMQWSNTIVVQKSVLLDVKFISQLPELIRGCEVTSLAMLLSYKGINIDKMKLADEVDKDNTPYSVVNGIAYYGDPSIGFIGSMTDANKNGYGANHAPITKLLKKYVGEHKAIDLTGLDFEHLYYYLSENLPVWVITNTDLKKLPDNQFYNWQTSKGVTIIATNKEHSVLITGYDNDYIYVNDPLHNISNRKVNKKDFIDAWDQMGKQAVTYIP
jgi:uncharacterized protein YvpB